MSRPSILICLPTVPMRQPYLANACMGFATRTEADFNLSIVMDADGAGMGWNRCIEQGLEWFPESTHILCGNDDVVCATGWDAPLIEACDLGHMPCPRIEPAGGHIRDRQIFQTHPPMPPDYFPVPRDPMAYFYADLQENQPTTDMQEIRSGNLPFISRAQWDRLGPFPPIHYGTDEFVFHRARQEGYKVVARMDSVFFNFNANIGRSREIEGVEWSEQMWLDWDGAFSLPKYMRGELHPTQTDPLRGTPEAAKMVKEWRKATFG